MRGVLPAIRVPTLVAHRVGDPHVRVGHGRYLAEHILGAELLELPGEDHLHFVGPGVDTLLSATERFIREQHPADEDGTHLTTVLFTDIVGSTELAARLGDVEWRRMVDAHDDAVTRRVRAARGRLVQLTGDGVVACFDSPARAVRAAIGFREDAAALGLVIRAGVHTGGVQQRLHNLAGITVHVAARVQDAAAPGEILVSRTCVDLVAGGDLTFSPRGEHALKGVPEPVQLYAVDLPSLAVPRQPPAPADATAS
jgi:class 3 adenylate cyclase